MYFGSNLQYLRRQKDGMTQEKLAQQLGVSRQTVSKWESGEVLPEIGNLLELAEIFSCKLDDLLKVDMSAVAGGRVHMVTVASFRYAQYVIISANACRDVLVYMKRWAGECGLQNTENCIHWGFPYVSAEQRNRFGLQGHAAAMILPEDFVPACQGAEICEQGTATYAVITIQEDVPSSQAYLQIMEYLGGAGIAKSAAQGYLPCFQREYEKNGMVYKDVFVLCENIETEETINLLNKE